MDRKIREGYLPQTHEYYFSLLFEEIVYWNCLNIVQAAILCSSLIVNWAGGSSFTRLFFTNSLSFFLPGAESISFELYERSHQNQSQVGHFKLLMG